ncbi:ABC1-domain-containing protein [Ceraceosorus guamensis]|uniref:ABC1-domain-containing protein n=1 Tax=Ceraceosorus guamensis TaxID=1522189 RepID=A0A316VZF8_9BASI|nr:ABC1-domain-containing protein [Ceraceosorus guamensis]PWN43047.1 ABC1-domain-containing protein [Ceraceosorus guamensis]
MPGTSTATHPLTVQEQKQGRQLVFDDYDATTAPRAIPLQAAKVPSSRFARALHYGGLGVGLAWGAAGSYLTGNSSRSTQGGGSGSDGTRQGSPILGEANLRRLVDKLSTMRGAALKLGQFLSIQDSNMLPPQLEEVLMRVQNSAHYMPQWQLERVMTAELGASWRSQFDKFDDVPFASASIGQVHAAVVATDHTSPLAGQRVAVKVQFPGVRASIASDLGNLRWLLAVSAVLPKGLFLDNTIRVMKRELDDECDYAREADMMRRFRSFIEHSDVFAVPRVVDELSTGQVLTTEMMRGRPLTQAGRYTQEKRNQIARSILELSLRELFEYRLMQTDPNWTNFLFNEATNKIELIDFGAARAYEKEFIDDWLCMLRAAIGGQRQACIEWSEKVGYLTGQESEAMRNAHVDSMIALGEPFRQDAPDPYPFAEQTITARVRAQIPLMLRERLTPPPEQTYSLNRKLSGAFLLCARLGAQVSCSNMFEEVTRDYMLGSASSTPLPSDTARRNGNVGGDQGQRLDLAGRRAFHSSAARHSPPESRRVNLNDRWPRHVIAAIPNAPDAEDPASKTAQVASLAPSGGTAAPSLRSTADDPGSHNPILLSATVPAQKSSPADSPTTAASSEPAAPILVRGISIPPKPEAPGSEDCCMSGCVHCVYDMYADDLEAFHEARNQLLSLTPPLTDDEWPSHLLGPRPETAPNFNGAKEQAQAEADAHESSLDPSMQAFLAMERGIKAKRANSPS